MNARSTLLVLSVFVLAACDDKKTTGTTTTSASAPATSASVATATSASAAPSSSSSGEPQWITAQHILVAYKGAKGAQGSILRTKAQAKERADLIDAKAKAGEDFSGLARIFSDDLGSRDRDGNLGKFTRDKMVPAFASAAFNLSVGAVSDVVETPFGYHIIKRNQ